MIHEIMYKMIFYSLFVSEEGEGGGGGVLVRSCYFAICDSPNVSSF